MGLAPSAAQPAYFTTKHLVGASRFRIHQPHYCGLPTTYESLARKGETMTTAAMAAYAYDQIEQARAELNAVSK